MALQLLFIINISSSHLHQWQILFLYTNLCLPLIAFRVIFSNLNVFVGIIYLITTGGTGTSRWLIYLIRLLEVIKNIRIRRINCSLLPYFLSVSVIFTRNSYQKLLKHMEMICKKKTINRTLITFLYHDWFMWISKRSKFFFETYHHIMPLQYIIRSQINYNFHCNCQIKFLVQLIFIANVHWNIAGVPLKLFLRVFTSANIRLKFCPLLMALISLHKEVSLHRTLFPFWKKI